MLLEDGTAFLLEYAPPATSWSLLSNSTACMLMTDGTPTLMEDGIGTLLLEGGPPSTAWSSLSDRTASLLLEDGTSLLMEDGGTFLLEYGPPATVWQYCPTLHG